MKWMTDFLHNRLRITVFVASILVIAQPTTVIAADSFVYTALGDSLPFGAFAPIGRGYVPTYEQFVETDNGVSALLINLGIPGWTSHDLAQALHSNFLFRLSVFYSNVVTLNIGGNDLAAARRSYKGKTCGGSDNQDCLKAAVVSFKSNWLGIIAAIRSLRQGRPTIIRTMDIYNPYVNTDKASDTVPGDGVNDFQALKPYLDDVNAYIASTSATNGILSATVSVEFNGPLGDQDPTSKGYLAFDRFHPNGLGHAVIAGLLRNLGYASTVP